jgi:hypothetical protein
MDKIPEKWRSGEVWNKWEGLRQKYSGEWSFLFENQQDDDIHLTALFKTLDGRRHVQYEIVHSPDFHNLSKVCAKIDSLEKKVQEASKLTL